MHIRDYQQQVILEAKKSFKSGNKSVLIYSATGSGKTIISAGFIKQTSYDKVLVIVNKETLFVQTYEKYVNMGINTAVVHNKIRYDTYGNLLNTDVSNCQVLITIIGSSENIPRDFIPNLIVFDEAHKATSLIFQELRTVYNGCPILGLTATPGRAKNKDGEYLTEWYDHMISTITMKELIKKGYLVQPVYIHSNSDDHVVNTWLSITANYTNKKTILFTQDTGHSKEMKKAFDMANIKAEIITTGSEEFEVSKQSPVQRQKIFKDFIENKIDVLISVMALCEGFDIPETQFCFICRGISEDNIALFHQIVGRVLRPHDSKKFGIIVDFHNNIKKFGPVEEYQWELDEPIKSIVLNNTQTLFPHQIRNKKLFMCCDNCNHVYDMNSFYVCTNCEHENSITVKIPIGTIRDDILQKLKPNMLNNLLEHSKNDKNKAFKSFLDIAKRANSIELKKKLSCLYFKDTYIFDSRVFNSLLQMKNVKMDEYLEVKNGIS